MQDDPRKDKPDSPEPQGFLSSLVQGLIRDTAMLWVSVLIGCILGLVACLYFGLPLGFALVGGAVVMAVYVAWNNL